MSEPQDFFCFDDQIGDKFLFGFASQSCGFTGEVEFEGEIIDYYYDEDVGVKEFTIWTEMFGDIMVNDENDKIIVSNKINDDIRLIKKLKTK